MGKYLHKFESVADFNEKYNGSSYIEPWVSATKDSNDEYQIDYNKQDGGQSQSPLAQ